jgi:hypothetical protein
VEVVAQNPGPLRIGIDGMGGLTERLAPEHVVGPPGFRHAHWQSISGGYYVNLFDYRGRPTDAGIDVGNWYGGATGIPRDNPDALMMAGTNNGTGDITVFGLDPEGTYDIVYYFDMDGKAKGFQYSWEAPDSIRLTMYAGPRKGGTQQASVVMREPDADPGDGVYYDWKGYVEATKENGYVGNYAVFRDIAAGPGGLITVVTSYSDKMTGMQIVDAGAPSIDEEQLTVSEQTPSTSSRHAAPSVSLRPGGIALAGLGSGSARVSLYDLRGRCVCRRTVATHRGGAFLEWGDLGPTAANAACVVRVGTSDGRSSVARLTRLSGAGR